MVLSLSAGQGSHYITVLLFGTDVKFKEAWLVLSLCRFFCFWHEPHLDLKIIFISRLSENNFGSLMCFFFFKAEQSLPSVLELGLSTLQKATPSVSVSMLHLSKCHPFIEAEMLHFMHTL